MVKKILLLAFTLAILTSCASNQSKSEVDKAIAEACKNVRADGSVGDLYGTEKKFLALAKLDSKYLPLFDLYSTWMQESSLEIRKSTVPIKYPPFPRTIKLFCTE